MASSAREDDEKRQIDPSKPFKGIVVCCTRIPHEERTELANHVVELGGKHRYDLTPDVTHLLVADYETPKYRHVAYERPDIKAMDAQWVEAVRDLWKNDEEIDFDEIEKQYQLKPLERSGVEPTSLRDGQGTRGSLLICLTKFGRQRDEIAEKIVANGGRYTADFTKKCTHLIVHKPEGKKFTAAKSWGIYAVTLDWLDQSIERGMILQEATFDPLLPVEEQGKDAWIKKDPRRSSLGKRVRSEASNAPEDGPRKLSRTASLKLRSQGQNLWGDILGKSLSGDPSVAQEHRSSNAAALDTSLQRPHPLAAVTKDKDVFANCIFCSHGFTKTQKTHLEQNVIPSHGGIVYQSVDDIALVPAKAEPLHRFLVVPQTSQPDTHPQTAHENIHVVTDFFIERCLHRKRLFHPSDHVLGRPFPRFPIPGFEKLIICKAGFSGIELSQLGRSIKQLGAKYSDDFAEDTSVLVCESLETLRNDKRQVALKWGVPVVSADWLWECISTGFQVPVEDFILPELKAAYREMKLPPAEATRQAKAVLEVDQSTKNQETRSCKGGPPQGAGVDTTAFDHDATEKRPKVSRAFAPIDSTTSADFFTPQTHRADSFAPDRSKHPVDTAAAPERQPPAPRLAIGPQRILSDPSINPTMTMPEVPERAPSAPLPLEPVPPAKEDDRVAEEARKVAKAAERQALGSKITSLIQSAPTEEPGKSMPRPRRRQILGRAVSNASNASSAASADVSKAALDAFRSEIADSEDEEGPSPPATQLRYSDPEAQELRAALLTRMMGENGEVKGLGMAHTRMKSIDDTIDASGGRALRRR
ncbi:hypothetical protein S7711_09318 [Stachybotrys chartarum IBT 7711]|uniref:BRCT domain-containing protein n=1 Tax=Stachybotrys chartarum (strain CBS 109288 / IBT 7711) TaxID=1280523 RepID=A0A084ARQ9_STACB|nr:hypothetical protein S7711_09318 [Stachybotrys chartarum IBT 7711]